jgi:putative flippase GtrA
MTQLQRIVRELAKFGIVGAGAYVIDVGTFNLLRLHTSPIDHKPLTAKTIAAVLAITFAYFGNRHWTFRHRDRSGLAREYTLFFALNGVGLLIALACLAVSHYMLGFTSVVADNISANGVGLVLGTAFRFWSYRMWVFRARSDAGHVQRRRAGQRLSGSYGINRCNESLGVGQGRLSG